MNQHKHNKRKARRNTPTGLFKRPTLTLGIALSIFCAQQAQSAELKYGLDFESGDDQGGISFENIAPNPGKTPIIDEMPNASKAVTYSETSSNLAMKEGSFSIGTTACEEIDYLIQGDAATIVFSLMPTRASQSNLLNFEYGGHFVILSLRDDSSVLLFDFLGTRLPGEITYLPRNEWSTFALRFSGNQITLDIFHSGELHYSDVITTIDDVIRNGLGYVSHSGTAGLLFDDFAIYDDVLTDENIEQLGQCKLDNEALPQFITLPEPSTASLSLLALSFLLARRRRKLQ